MKEFNSHFFVILDRSDFTFSFIKTDGEWCIWLQSDNTQERGRYCRVVCDEVSDIATVELNSLSVTTDFRSAKKLFDYATYINENEDSLEFCCSTFNVTWLEEDPRDEFTWFPTDTSDIQIKPLKHGCPYAEIVVLTNFDGKTQHTRVHTEFIKVCNGYYIESDTGKNEISREQYYLMRSSSRALDIKATTHPIFGKVETFTLGEPPTLENTLNISLGMYEDESF